MKRLLFLFILIWHLPLFCGESPIKFVIVIPSYNNEKWCIENLESCTKQSYQNFIVIYVDDCSTDRTGKLIDDYVQSHNLKDKVFVIHNKKRAGTALANCYKVIHSLDPHCVVVSVDGDDKLMHTRVLEKLAAVYKDSNIWLTWGDYAPSDLSWTHHSAAFPPDVIKNKSYRKYKWVASHLKTYYAGLFQLINKEDLLFHDGNFFPMASDRAMLYPMIEMASPNHFRYIPEVLYWYRTSNPISEFRINNDLSNQCAKEIKDKKPYPSLSSLFSNEAKN
jgi:glycosyltransferase involved in cell wall biosynthesis